MILLLTTVVFSANPPQQTFESVTLSTSGETWVDNFTNDTFIGSYENLTIAHTLAGNYTQNYDQNQVRLPITFTVLSEP